MGVKGFVEGGIASVVAGCSTHPFDLIKVRMQLQGEVIVAPDPAPAAAHLCPLLGIPNASVPIPHPLPFPQPGVNPISVFLQILRSEGALGLFSGVTAAMLRQALYSTTRMGIYDILKTRWTSTSSNHGAASLPLRRKLAAGLIAGSIGAAVGNPADVALVRMQADGRLPPALRRNYRGVGDAIARMVRSEGVTSLWRGSTLTVIRAMLVTASQLASYDQTKEALIAAHMPDGLGVHVAASFVAGFVAALVSNPVDVVKTRIMNMPSQAPGEAPRYSGAIDCAVKTVKTEGPMALYKGFVPTVSRQGPFTIVLFVTLEQVKKLLKGKNF